MGIILRCLVLAAVSLYSLVAVGKEDEPLVVGLMEEGRPPYYWRTERGELTGLYIELIKLIGQHTGLQFTFKFTPQSRIRLRMLKDVLDIEPGIDKSWRQDAGEVESSSYSKPFMSSKEAWVYSKHHEVSWLDEESLSALVPCNIHGFDVTEVRKSPEKVLAFSDMQVLQLIQKGRCDYSVMPLDVFNYLRTNHKLHIHAARPHAEYQLRLRIQKHHEDLLPRIDKAIDVILKKGYMDRLLAKYSAPLSIERFELPHE